jgi:hypothetical protein
MRHHAGQICWWRSRLPCFLPGGRNGRAWDAKRTFLSGESDDWGGDGQLGYGPRSKTRSKTHLESFATPEAVELYNDFERPVYATP